MNSLDNENTNFNPSSDNQTLENKISPVFLVILFLTLIAGLLTYQNIVMTRLWVFLFVIGGWILSLSFHEFGHAFAAYHNGDKSVAEKGYLTLNPIKYTNLVMSIVIPVVFLMMGGIGFPGGAVYINMAMIPDPKKRSFVSFAGPLATALFAGLLLIPFFLGVPSEASAGEMPFWSALALLAFLQITALFLNLLPVPGLDGFGIIEPFLSKEVMIKLRKVGGIFILAIFFLLFNDTPVSKGFWAAIRFLTELLNLDISFVRDGFRLFQFWNM